jgi:MraZ protein
VPFTGSAEITIDAKQRLAIPAKYRSLLDPEKDKAWYCVPSPGGLIRLYSETEFNDLAARWHRTLTPTGDQAELEAELFSSAERIEMDSAGRITIPRDMLSLVGLGTDVVVIGALNRLEVRDRAKWIAGRQDRFARLAGLVEKVEARRDSGATN